MIRNLMLAVGLFTLTGASAMAAPVRHVTTTTHKVAKADEAAPADAKEPKKAAPKKGSHKAKKAKDGDAAPATPAPAPAK